MRVVFLNVAWMKTYDGMGEDDQPVNGGRHVAENGWGHEIFNFRPSRGTMYGYAPAAPINVTRLGMPPDADKATDVLVFWTATPKEGGRRIAGWYDQATVFRNEQPSHSGADRTLPDGSQAFYVATAASENCVLLPEAERDLLVPPKGPGSMGRAGSWYAEKPSVAAFREKAVSYVQRRSHDALLEKRKYWPGGEGPEHKALKEWCAHNPLALGLSEVIGAGITEYKFDKTGDRADVKFELTGGRYVVLEVETDNAEPGAYQALKYRVLMCAQNGLPITSEKVEGWLVAYQVPPTVREFCKSYNLRWKEAPPEMVGPST